jgi:carbon storage regulator CsrA
MLILGRKLGETIYIGRNKTIVVTVKHLSKGKVQLGIEAPKNVLILRAEKPDKGLEKG